MSDDLNFSQKILLLFFIFNFSGCAFLEKNRDVINMKYFEKITQGRFDSLDDIINIFPKNVADINRRTELCMLTVQDGIKQVLNIKDEDRNFENTARAMDKIKFKFSVISGAIEMLEMVSPDNGIRNAAHEAALKLREFAVDVFNDVEIYKAFKNYVELNAKKENLSSEANYFLQETMKDFIREGFDLPASDFERAKAIRKELAKISLEFEKNINEDKSSIKVERGALEGLKQDFIENLKKSDDGKYILGCDYPTYYEVMEHCKILSTRKDLYFKFQNRAYPVNMSLLNSLIDKRDELAKILNFADFASLDFDAQMAKKTKTVKTFLDHLVEKTMVKADREFSEFTRDLPEGVFLDVEGELSPWDFPYLKECYKKKHFDVDERKIAEYFPVENTIERIFDIYQQFLGLEFRQVEISGLWHKDVKFVEIYKSQNQEKLGVLFLDLYPRENKYSHACESTIVPTFEFEDTVSGKKVIVPAVIVVIANFPKATKTKPALLKHNDVTTFFHEFGHAMHSLLGRTSLVSCSGTAVKTDFVEMPSQMFEEWMWDKEMLKKVSCHYETGQPLPDELIEKKIALKKLGSGYFVTRQALLSFLSLNYFLPGQNKDTDKILKDLSDKYIKNIKFEPEVHLQASFGHLTGYGAKYYSYMWSKVFALDLFYEIKKEGLLSSAIGQKLISKILGKGGSCDPEILLKDFLGREPNQDAFLNDLGII